LGIYLRFEMGDIMENIGQLATTIFGFGFAFFAICN